MKLDPRHLLQLAAVVEAGGVTEGAAMIGSSQPAVSRTIALLEARLGETLFVPGRRPLRPTPFGLALADQGRGVLLAVRKAAEVAEGFRQGRTGAVRVGGTPFFMDALIAGMIAEFHRSYPEVRVDQSYGYTQELIAQVVAGEIDLAICPVDLIAPEADLDFAVILPGRNVVACREGHPLARRRGVRTEDLLAYPWIAPPPMSPLHADLRATLAALGAVHIRIAYSGGSLGSVLGHMRASDALSILPHSVVFAERHRREITALPLKLEQPQRSLGILRRRSAPKVPAVDHLAHHVARGFAALRDLIRRHEQAVIWGR